MSQLVSGYVCDVHLFMHRHDADILIELTPTYKIGVNVNTY